MVRAGSGDSRTTWTRGGASGTVRSQAEPGNEVMRGAEDAADGFAEGGPLGAERFEAAAAG